MTSPHELGVEILRTLEDGASSFPVGRTGGPEVLPYAQHAGPSCFYASLIAIQMTHTGQPPVNEVALVGEARDRNLILDSGMEGAQTGRQFYGAQTQFVRERLGLDVEFVDPLYPVPVAERLIRAIADGDEVVFGLHSRKHWVALDGLKRTFGRESAWTGMDPDGGTRIEYPSRVLQESLSIAGMPLVVVKNPNVERSEARFTTAKPRFSRHTPTAPDASRFSGKPAKPRFRPSRG
jgi:hypothetical protein